MNTLPPGRHFFRTDDRYEAVRRSTVWNQRVPERYPEVIVEAVGVDDVIAALAYAKANDRQVSIRSGGHSWAANHLRDGAVLLDLHRLDHTTVDAANRTAVVGPGKGGSEPMNELTDQRDIVRQARKPVRADNQRTRSRRNIWRLRQSA